MADLQKMLPAIGTSGNWIPILVEEQEHAVEYKEDEDEGYFVTTMASNYETPVRVN